MSSPEASRRTPAQRLPEAVALFNSVLCSEVLVHACWQKEQYGSEGLPWAAAFVVLPLALHPPTRQALPRDSRLTLTAWAVRHPDLIADMDRRVAVMTAPTKRAIRSAMRTGRLALVDTHLTAPRRPRSAATDWPSEIKEAVRAARICGRWFNGLQTHLAFEALGIGS